MPHGAVSAIATHNIGSPKGDRLPFVVEMHSHASILFNRGYKGGLVLNSAAFALELLRQQLLGHVLWDHRNELVRALMWLKTHVRQPLSMCDHRDRRHPVCFFQKRSHDSRHIEDLHGARKDGKRLGIL